MKLNQLKTKASPILADYGVTKASVFGSFARGKTTSDSDIDLLVQLGRKMSLLEFIELKHKLEDSLNRKVDLVQYDKIKPILKPYILADEQVFYQQ